MPADTQCSLPGPITIRPGDHDLDELLSREILLTNRLGSYASCSVIGCNTRRYHGLLVASTRPPVGRIVMLSTLMEQLITGQVVTDLATNEFNGTFSPQGYRNLLEYRDGPAPTWVFQVGDVELTRQLALHETRNVLAVRYTLRGPAATLRIVPFTALRDFHHLRDADAPQQLTFETSGETVLVRDRNSDQIPGLAIHAPGCQFTPHPDWWRQFRYRTDLGRGQDGHEDLYTPGHLQIRLEDGQSLQITAGVNDASDLDFEDTVTRREKRLAELACSLDDEADETDRRLAAATDAFLVRRDFQDGSTSTSILAGYHWFADWGRDTFIALPGLLLSTGRFDQARQVFRTFAENIRNGMVPNRFDDYSPTAHYNSLDASLWFIIAAERYMQATDDADFWSRTLMPAIHEILTAYRQGTQFDIFADADGLISGGSEKTQLTWMDAKLGHEAITPRHGKAVEINAMWNSAHWIMARRCEGVSPDLADQYSNDAVLIARAFGRTFWNPTMNCLYDCVTYGQPDGTVRPNQIFAVSLPYSPLLPEQQQAVVNVVRDKLLTPVGLRTISPDDPRYRRRYGGSWESRDRAYHQGTVWAWLIGAFIEAHLRTAGNREQACESASQWLSGFADHLQHAGLGSISEIFDGDEPHFPRGCIAQAWSVAEVLRARKLVRDYRAGRWNP